MEKNELKALLKKCETLELTDEERKKCPGSFINLPCGNTHYQMEGDGEPVVLVHGYATPYFIYDKIYKTLLSQGYKVLRYDLLGRGLSERINSEYCPQIFAIQLYQLTKALLGDEKFILFGTSMGGTVTTTYCRLFPGNVKKLVLLAPAGMDNFEPPFYMKLCSAPVLGKALFKIIGKSVLVKRCAGEMIYSPDEKDDFMRNFAYCAKYKGFIESTRQSLKNTIINTDVDVKGYFSIAEQRIPTLCIWGTIDKTMPYYQMKRFQEIYPDAQFVTFEGSGHIFLYDEEEKTMDIVLPFLDE